jgi:hypothetical protein
VKEIWRNQKFILLSFLAGLLSEQKSSQRFMAANLLRAALGIGATAK